MILPPRYLLVPHIKVSFHHINTVFIRIEAAPQLVAAHEALRKK